MTIKEIRTRMNLTQEGFAIKFDIPKRTIENWEGGVSKCPDYVRQLIQYKAFKEGYIVNTKITYRWTSDYENSPFADTDHIVTDGVYDFSDFLSDRGVNFVIDDQDPDLYWVLDEFDERTGEAFLVISVLDTDEEV